MKAILGSQNLHCPFQKDCAVRIYIRLSKVTYSESV